LDGRDTNRCERLTVAGSLAVILAAAKLLDDDFLILELANDRGFDRNAAQRWLADFGIAFAGNEQDFIKAQFGIRIASAKVNNDFIAHSHAILVAAILSATVSTGA
jgi:hypothetical protein